MKPHRVKSVENMHVKHRGNSLLNIILLSYMSWCIEKLNFCEVLAISFRDHSKKKQYATGYRDFPGDTSVSCINM